MLNIIWIILIVVLVISSFYVSKNIKFRNYNIKNFIILFKTENKSGVFLTLGTKIGVGSIISVASSIYIGGIGSIFWMILFSLITSSLIYIESYFANVYKKESTSGLYEMYNKALNKKYLAIICTIILIITYSCFFLMIQTNTLSNIIALNTSINKYIMISILSIMIIIFIFFSLKELLISLNKLVPYMCLLYIILGLYLFISNHEIVFKVFYLVIENAFNKQSFLTGLLIGVKRSIFTSEVLVGTTSIASFNNKNPHKEASMQTLSVYFISFVVTIITSFMIIVYRIGNIGSYLNYNELITNVFTYHFGSLGSIILIMLLLLFAFTTIISGFYIGLSNLKKIINNKICILIFRVVVVIFCIWGMFIDTSFMWESSDIFLLMLISLNTYGILKIFKGCDKNEFD